MNLYFHFTTDGTDYLSFPISAIIGITFDHYQDKYRLYLILNDGSGEDRVFPFASFDYWNEAKSKWQDIERAYTINDPYHQYCLDNKDGYTRL